jgi:hypothetical protein
MQKLQLSLWLTSNIMWHPVRLYVCACVQQQGQLLGIGTSTGATRHLPTREAQLQRFPHIETLQEATAAQHAACLLSFRTAFAKKKIEKDRPSSQPHPPLA